MISPLKTSRSLRTLFAAPAAAVMLLAALPADAQSTEMWRYKAALNLYLPEIGGSTSFPVNTAPLVAPRSTPRRCSRP